MIPLTHRSFSSFNRLLLSFSPYYNRSEFQPPKYINFVRNSGKAPISFFYSLSLVDHKPPPFPSLFLITPLAFNPIASLFSKSISSNDQENGKVKETETEVLDPHPEETLFSSAFEGYPDVQEIPQPDPIILQTYQQLCEKFATNDPRVVISKEKLGLNFLDIGRVEEGLEMLTDVLKTKLTHSQYFGEMNHQQQQLEIGISYLNCARAFQEDLKLKTALEYSENAHQIISAAVQEDIHHPKLIESLRTLAICLEKVGENERSLSIYQKLLGLLDDLQQTLSVDSHELLEVYPAEINEAIGTLFEKLGRLEEALSHHLCSLELKIKHIGTENSVVAYSHANIGLLLKKLNRKEESIESLKRAIKLFEAHVGKGHFFYAYLYYQLEEMVRPTPILE